MLKTLFELFYCLHPNNECINLTYNFEFFAQSFIKASHNKSKLVTSTFFEIWVYPIIHITFDIIFTKGKDFYIIDNILDNIETKFVIELSLKPCLTQNKLLVISASHFTLLLNDSIILNSMILSFNNKAKCEAEIIN